MNEKARDRALAAIKRRSSRAAVAEFLKSKGIHHSAKNWDDLLDRRIKPAISDGSLTENDIGMLLRDAEDYGHQHVFVFGPSQSNSDPKAKVDHERIKQVLKKNGSAGLLNNIELVDMPTEPRLVDVQLDPGSVSLKIVEPRFIKIIKREETTDGYRVREVPKTVRAVNVLTVLDTGYLEIRVATLDGTPSYEVVAHGLWTIVSPYFNEEDYRPRELAKARRKCTVDPSPEVMKRLRVRRTSLRNVDDYKFNFAAGRPGGNLLQATYILRGVHEVAGGAVSRSGATSVGFLPSDDGGLPSRELGVNFTDSINEYIVLPNCTRQEHEYIRDQIRNLAK